MDKETDATWGYLAGILANGQYKDKLTPDSKALTLVELTPPKKDGYYQRNASTSSGPAPLFRQPRLLHLFLLLSFSRQTLSSPSCEASGTYCS